MDHLPESAGKRVVESRTHIYRGIGRSGFGSHGAGVGAPKVRPLTLPGPKPRLLQSTLGLTLYLSRAYLCGAPDSTVS